MGILRNKENLRLEDKDIKLSAFWEMSKALYTIVNKTSFQVYKVSVLPHGDGLGSISYLNSENETS